jgi:gamma-glutamyltranspeptidase/glutathione hydrolase
MAPTIVYGPDGEVRLAVGAAGGPTIIAQVAKAIIGVVDWNLSAQDAIALPQIVAIENNVRMEETPRSAPIIADLRRRGHQVTVASPRTFKANAVERVAGRWVGAADPRSEGVGRTE